jgi:two-component system chemotaxis response regulator CheY
MAETSTGAEEPLNMARILLVDDEPYIQTLYGDILERAGHEVIETAYNGEEAVLRYELLWPKPDLVLMDHRMPIKNGMEATREILELDPAATILFVWADQTIRDKVVEIGAAGFIGKPFDLVVLLETIERLVADARRARSHERMTGEQRQGHGGDEARIDPMHRARPIEGRA